MEKNMLIMVNGGTIIVMSNMKYSIKTLRSISCESNVCKIQKFLELPERQ